MPIYLRFFFNPTIVKIDPSIRIPDIMLDVSPVLGTLAEFSFDLFVEVSFVAESEFI